MFELNGREPEGEVGKRLKKSIRCNLTGQNSLDLNCKNDAMLIRSETNAKLASQNPPTPLQRHVELNRVLD